MREYALFYQGDKKCDVENVQNRIWLKGTMCVLYIWTD